MCLVWQESELVPAVMNENDNSRAGRAWTKQRKIMNLFGVWVGTFQLSTIRHKPMTTTCDVVLVISSLPFGGNKVCQSLLGELFAATSKWKKNRKERNAYTISFWPNPALRLYYAACVMYVMFMQERQWDASLVETTCFGLAGNIFVIRQHFYTSYLHLSKMVRPIAIDRLYRGTAVFTMAQLRPMS